MDYIQKFKDVLSREKLKFTPKRLVIFNNVIRSREHRGSEKIHKDVNKKLNISLATVYRTLDLLVKNNFIRKMDIGSGKYIYETKVNHPHHDHIICIECGKIIEFQSEKIELIQDEICKKLKFKIVHHIHQLFGKCEQCQ